MSNVSLPIEETKKEEYYFIYVLGELTNASEIVEEINCFFPNITSNYINIVVLHTLVTFKKAKEIREELLCNQKKYCSVKSFLVPATEYAITRYIIRDYDTSNTIIRIRGGSWINAIAIADEIKRAKITCSPNGYFKYYDIMKIPENWNIRCVKCGALIPERKQEIFERMYKSKCVLICTNPNCEKINRETTASTDNTEYKKDYYLNNSNLVEVKKKV